HLFGKLERLGLVEQRFKTRLDSYCYYFDAKAAQVYMAVLADYLARNDSELTIPGTDQVQAFDLSFKRSSGTAKDLSVAVKLFDILPRPAGDVALRKILRFREKYRAELLAFRAVMDSFEAGLAEAPDERTMNSFLVRSKEQIEQKCLDLQSAL